jgi:hypothetical protein
MRTGDFLSVTGPSYGTFKSYKRKGIWRSFLPWTGFFANFPRETSEAEIFRRVSKKPPIDYAILDSKENLSAQRLSQNDGK